MSWGYAAVSLLPGLLEIIGIKDYKGLDTSLKNKLTDFAQQLIDKWQLKQQESAYSPDFQSSSLPNRNQLQALMYQEFANETRKLAQDIQNAQVKDMQNWDNNRGWYMLQDGVGGALKLLDTAGRWLNIPAIVANMGQKAVEDYLNKQGIDVSKIKNDAYHFINQTEAKYKARNKNMLEAADKAEQLKKSQKETFNKFNNYVIQSRDRFGRNKINNNNNQNYKSHSDTTIKNGTNTERINRETKF